MLSGEETHTKFIVFGVTRPGLEPTNYRTRGEHANHYGTDAVRVLRDKKHETTYELYNKDDLIGHVKYN